jgi:hypothetical protein
MEKLNIQGGLRSEYTAINILQKTLNEEHKDDYLKSAILDVFNFDLSLIESKIKKVDWYNEILNPLEDYSFLKEKVKDFIII